MIAHPSASSDSGTNRFMLDEANPAPYAQNAKRGVDEEVVQRMSAEKQEPTWMLEHRLSSLQSFWKMPLPAWGPDLMHLDFANIIYYARHGAEQAYACSCFPQDAENAFADGNVVFRGEVIGIEENESAYSKQVAFSVDAVWQGPAVNGLVLTTALNSAACGIDFVIGREYTVVATQQDGELNASLCGQHYIDENGNGMSPDQLVEDRNPKPMQTNVQCEPYVCSDGSIHAACSADGQQINYFAEPCHTSGGPQQPPSSSGFSDVPTSHASFNAIVWARQQGIVEGYADGTFRPGTYVNRAEFTKILIEAYDINTQALCRMASFPDAPLNAWYGAYVQAARCQGVVSGYPDGTFRPSANINFAEAAKIVANLNAGSPLSSPGGDLWYRVYTDYLYDRSAVPNSIGSMGQLVTRAEMVEMMHRLRGGSTVPTLPQEGPLTGRIETMQRPAPDIAYDFMLVLDEPMRDPWNAAGEDTIVSQVVIVPTSPGTENTIRANVGANVMVSGHMEWGYAESRVFMVEAVAVE